MRTISAELGAQLSGGVTTLAHVWRVTRRDGVEFGFTDHDRSLAFDSLICAPASGMIGGALEKSLGLSVDTASIAGALSAEVINNDDLARGVWDGARVDIYRVDWRDPAARVHLFAGTIGEVRRGLHAFEAELRGLQAGFNRAAGRVFSRNCDADIGDARCGVDLEAEAYRGEGIVVSVINARSLRVSGLDAFADGWFARGTLAWSMGGRVEVATHRVEAGAAVLELFEAGGAALMEGAGFIIRAGCDKAHATCGAKFANAANFRGFPHMPGPDAVVAGPVAGERHDGSKR